jgi:thiol peroxidase
MAGQRSNEVTFKGNPVELAGPRLEVGDPAPDFECVGAGLALVKLSDTPSKARMFSVVPSLDTPVCSVQTKTFSDQLNSLGDQVAAYTVSLDMPFAQARFCEANQIQDMKNLSDVRNHSFGQHYGVLVTSLPIPLLCRAVFVVGKDGTIRHVEYVKEIASAPDYPSALAALQAAAKE